VLSLRLSAAADFCRWAASVTGYGSSLKIIGLSSGISKPAAKQL
jgi:hypothetical protein